MKIYEAVSDLTKTIGRLNAIRDIYPDVQIYKDNFGKLIPHSQKANGDVRFFSLSQGTNVGRPTTMLAWKEFAWRGEMVRVFGEVNGSPVIHLGKINSDGFDMLLPEMESKLLKNGMSGFAIDYVRTHAEEIKKHYDEFMKEEEEDEMLESLRDSEWFGRLKHLDNEHIENLVENETTEKEDE